LGSRTDADEVLQDTFVRLARARKRLTQVTNLTATDAQTGRWFYERMVSGRMPEDSYRIFLEGYQRILNVKL